MGFNNCEESVNMHHFFVSPAQVGDEFVTIEGNDVNHIKNVLRMKTGEKILVSNNTDRDYCCEVTEINDDSIKARIIETDFTGTEPGCFFYLFQGLPKSDKMESIIQKSVELGVFEIIPVETKRSIVKFDPKKKESKIKRYNLISESAAKQSRRSIIPVVKDVMTFKQALEYAKDFDINIIPYENFKDMKTTKEIIAKVRVPMKIGIFIGPEGGFDDSEVSLAKEFGVTQISLGKRILRTETAGPAILSVLMFQTEE